jgi:hypothetical protein
MFDRRKLPREEERKNLCKLNLKHQPYKNCKNLTTCVIG